MYNMKLTFLFSIYVYYILSISYNMQIKHLIINVHLLIAKHNHS